MAIQSDIVKASHQPRRAVGATRVFASPAIGIWNQEQQQISIAACRCPPVCGERESLGFGDSHDSNYGVARHVWMWQTTFSGPGYSRLLPDQQRPEPSPLCPQQGLRSVGRRGQAWDIEGVRVRCSCIMLQISPVGSVRRQPLIYYLSSIGSTRTAMELCTITQPGRCACGACLAALWSLLDA